MEGIGYTILVGMAPLDAELLDALQDVELECSLEEASVFRMRFGISQTDVGDWSILDADPFRPLAQVQIRIQSGTSPPEAVLNGYVTTSNVSYGEAGSSTLEVTGMDATLLMNLEEKVKAWQNMPDGAIAAAIFGEHTIVPMVDVGAPVLTDPEGTTIQRGTDIRFLRRLAVRNGFDCYVQPEPLTGLDQGFFKARQLAGTAQAVLNVGLGDDTNVEAFSVRYDGSRPTTAVTSGIDPLTGSSQPAQAPIAAEQPLGSEAALQRMTGATILPTDLGLTRSGDLQRAIQAIVDRSAWAVVAEGTAGADVPVLRPGALVNIRGAGRFHNGSYLVTRVRHTLAAGEYQQSFEAQRNALSETGAEMYVELGI